MSIEDPFTGLRPEPGWFGQFTRAQADGAIPNGTLIEKVNSQPGDGHPNGTLGTVLGSFAAPPIAGFEDVTYCYFIEWRPRPRFAVGTTNTKIRRAVRD